MTRREWLAMCCFATPLVKAAVGSEVDAEFGSGRARRQEYRREE